MHDIEFATEISTSLLAQVRQLQAILAEKDDALKTVTLQKSQLEHESQGFAQRLRNMDESEQRYKDENWSLETQTHDLMAAAKESAEREQKLQQTLAATTSEKSSALRELDEVRERHMQLSEEHVAFRRNHDTELGGLRKTIGAGDNDRVALQRKIEELTSQNQELAKAFAGRFKGEEDVSARELASEPEDFSLDRLEADHSPPPSPSKSAVRHNHLETETMKTSLHHAQRMIQNLKSTIHREKTEKLELKRMLQESRDELELRRNDANELANKKTMRKSQSTLGKKTINPYALGMSRTSRTDIEMEDPAWENSNGQGSPSPQTPTAQRPIIQSQDSFATTGTNSDAYQTANETEGFETANERDTVTESEAFQTGAESPTYDSSDGLTETEGRKRSGTVRGVSGVPIITSAKPGNRQSFVSTASTSGSEDERNPKTPISAQTPRFKHRLNRGSRKSRITSEEPSPGLARDSPASFVSNSGPKGQSLFAELGGLDNDSGEEGTPGRSSILSARSTPAAPRPPTAQQSLSTPSPVGVVIPTVPTIPAVQRPPMVDSGVMTEPWEDRARPDSATLGGVKAVNMTPPNEPVKHENEPPQIAWDQPLKKFENIIPTFGGAFLTPRSNKSTDINEDRVASSPDDGSTDRTSRRISTSPTTPEQQRADDALTVPTKAAVPLTFSAIQSIETKPIERPAMSSRGSSKDDVVVLPPPRAESEEPAPSSATGGGILGSVLRWTRSNRQPAPGGNAESEDETAPSTPPTPSTPSMLHTQTRSAPSDMATAGDESLSTTEATNTTTEYPKNAILIDHSSQTILSAQQIDALLANSSRRPSPIVTNGTPRNSMSVFSPHSDIGSPPQRSPPLPPPTNPLPETPKTASRVTEPMIVREAAPMMKSLRRPGSKGSIRTDAGASPAPPLPVDHRKVIAAASQRNAPSETNQPGSMGPPLMPASAYNRPSSRTRNAQVEQNPQTPNTVRQASGTSRTRYSTTRSGASRRSSFSSFASELDERFNIRADGMMMPAGLESGADPRMIQAITQTMIGEPLWKYTRKPGRTEMSDNRHLRFFWVHPYTRTLYWSDQDPRTAGKVQLKAKSVAIESIQVVNDDNPFPPGLHRKSIVVVTPGRSVKFTATTAQRHETWFNSLAYLLLRTAPHNSSHAHLDATGLTAADIAEFNPTMQSRSQSRTGRSMHSSASHSRAGNTLTQQNFRATSRTSSRGPSPNRAASNMSQNRPNLAPNHQAQGSTASRYSQSSNSASTVVVQPEQPQPQHASFSSRVSSYFRPARGAEAGRASVMGSVRSKSSARPVVGVRGGGSRAGSQASLREGEGLYGEGGAGRPVNDSAEDVRRVMERQEKEADRLENVRACCDGKSLFFSVLY